MICKFCSKDLSTKHSRLIQDVSPGAKVVSQRAGRLVGGEQRSEIARVQLWESTTISTGRGIPRELLDDSESTSTLRNLPRTTSPPPVIPLWESISTLTLSQDVEAVLTPTTSPSSSSPSIDVQQLPLGSHRRPSEAGRMNSAFQHNPDRRSMATQGMSYLKSQINEAPSNRNPDLGWDQASHIQRNPPQQRSPPPLALGARLTRRASRAMSFMSQSSTSSLAQSTMSGNLVQVDTSGTLGCIIDHPDPSRLVLFLKGQSQFDPHALLIIDSRFLQFLFER